MGRLLVHFIDFALQKIERNIRREKKKTKVQCWSYMIVFFLEGRLILVDFVDFALQKIEKKYKERKNKGKVQCWSYVKVIFLAC